MRPAALFKITRDSSIYMAGCSTLLDFKENSERWRSLFPPQTLSIVRVYSSIPMKTIKKATFGAVLFCSASVGFAILPPDASPSSAGDSASIYRKDFVWASVEKAKATQIKATASNKTGSADVTFIPTEPPRFVPTEPRFVPTEPRFVPTEPPHISFVPTNPRTS
jgi:hypothetical protein